MLIAIHGVRFYAHCEALCPLLYMDRCFMLIPIHVVKLYAQCYTRGKVYAHCCTWSEAICSIV